MTVSGSTKGNPKEAATPVFLTRGSEPNFTPRLSALPWPLAREAYLAADNAEGGHSAKSTHLGLWMETICLPRLSKEEEGRRESKGHKTHTEKPRQP